MGLTRWFGRIDLGSEDADPPTQICWAVAGFAVLALVLGIVLALYSRPPGVSTHYLTGPRCRCGRSPISGVCTLPCTRMGESRCARTSLRSGQACRCASTTLFEEADALVEQLDTEALRTALDKTRLS